MREACGSCEVSPNWKDITEIWGNPGTWEPVQTNAEFLGQAIGMFS